MYTSLQVLIAQEAEAKESFEQLEMLKRTHDKLRTRAEELEIVNDRLFGELEIIKKTLMASQSRRVKAEFCPSNTYAYSKPRGSIPSPFGKLPIKTIL